MRLLSNDVSQARVRVARRACTPASAGARRAGVRAAADAAQRDAQPGPGQRGQPGARRLRYQHRHLPDPDQEPGPEAAALQPGCAHRRRRRCCVCKRPPHMLRCPAQGARPIVLRAGLPTLTSAPAGGAQEGPAAAARKGSSPPAPAASRPCLATSCACAVCAASPVLPDEKCHVCQRRGGRAGRGGGQGSVGARMGGPDVDVWRRLRFLPRSGAGERAPSHRSQRSAESSVLLSSQFCSN